MAMLAEPKRRVPRVNVRASTTWSKDESKFGQRLLERMGWSQGRGLGANLDGETKSVPLRVKLDSKGLGFTAKDDQWTSHETLFQGLLQNLNGDSTTSSTPVLTSLEKKSKNLQSRIHYKKFTRGKDISQYSPKDLANIFGKKSLEKPSKSETVLASTEEDSSYNFVSAGNIDDYFSSKKNLKLTSNIQDGKADENCDFAFRGFSGAGSYPENAEIVENESVKRKKKKKRKDEDSGVQDENCEFSFIGFSRALTYPEDVSNEPAKNENETIELEPVKSKKKKKRKADDSDVNCDFSFVGFSGTRSPPEDISNEPEENEVVENEPIKSKKKKKRKADDKDVNCDFPFVGFSGTQTHPETNSNEPEENENEPIKKKKKRKFDSDLPENVTCDITSVKKKKKKTL